MSSILEELNYIFTLSDSDSFCYFFCSWQALPFKLKFDHDSCKIVSCPDSLIADCRFKHQIERPVRRPTLKISFAVFDKSVIPVCKRLIPSGLPCWILHTFLNISHRVIVRVMFGKIGCKFLTDKTSCYKPVSFGCIEFNDFVSGFPEILYLFLRHSTFHRSDLIDKILILNCFPCSRINRENMIFIQFNKVFCPAEEKKAVKVIGHYILGNS